SNICPESGKSNFHEFRMYTFETTTSCSSCKMLLRGVFYQGYRCSKCGAGAHKECLGRVDNCVKSSAGEPFTQLNNFVVESSVYTAFVYMATEVHVSVLCDVFPRCTLMIDLDCSETDRAIMLSTC
ncbi:hypothetical protein DNTS_028286, partial [Danionella cerebrum]